MSTPTPTKRVFLLPGELHFAREPTMISTLLGSCVAVCLIDVKRHAAGMNHFLLPTAMGHESSPGKCGDQAIAQLVKLARLSGSPETDLSAIIVGGGAVIGNLLSSQQANLADIGVKNVQLARETLQRLRIPVARAETGGVLGRRINLNSQTGALQIDAIQREPLAPVKPIVGRRIRVLIVDDSVTVRNVLRQAISADPGFEVCGEAKDPYEARDLILSDPPDVISLDIIMPGLDGVSFLRRLMSSRPIPTVIVSTIAKQGSDMERNAMAAGAVATIDKERLALYQGVEVVKSYLLPILRKAAAAQVKVRS